jgi:nucleoside-diphosphate-sugar epimerase
MVVVLGGGGFVGSAFVRLLESRNIPHRSVGRGDYSSAIGTPCDLLLNASGNSVKYLADRDPAADFRQSVDAVVAASKDFRPRLHVLISSVDVYADLARPESTREDTPLNPADVSMYGFHKQLAELCVRRHNQDWLIVRLGGMVGPGLRKNPVFDVLNGAPLRISPDSRYQFMSTDDVADVTWQLVESGERRTVFNVCGSGLISPREIAALAGREFSEHAEAQAVPPRIVDVAIDRVSRVRPMPSTRDTIARFVAERAARAGG